MKATRATSENWREKLWVRDWVDAADYDKCQEALRAARNELYDSKGDLDPIQLHILLDRIESVLEDED